MRHLNLMISTSALYQLPERDPKIDLPKPAVATNWMAQLKIMLPEGARPKLDKHIGPESGYAHKQALIDALEMVYCRLNGDYDVVLGTLDKGSRELITYKLQEEIKACDEGYHNRVNSIVQGFVTPKSFREMLYLLRREVVESTAVASTDLVHDYNQFFAQAKRFGVFPLNANDPYPGAALAEAIQDILQQAFKYNFNSLYLPKRIMQFLQERIIDLGYIGVIEDGYTVGSIERIINFLQQVFGLSADECTLDLIFCNEEGSDVYTDVNWDYVAQKIISALFRCQCFRTKIKSGQDPVEYYYYLLLALYDRKTFAELDASEQAYIVTRPHAAAENFIHIALQFGLDNIEEMIRLLQELKNNNVITAKEYCYFLTEENGCGIICVHALAQNNLQALNLLLDDLRRSFECGDVNQQLLDVFLKQDGRGRTLLHFAA